MGWWGNNSRKDDAQNKRAREARQEREYYEREYVEARIIDRRGPRSELRAPRQRRGDTQGRFVYR